MRIREVLRSVSSPLHQFLGGQTLVAITWPDIKHLMFLIFETIQSVYQYTPLPPPICTYVLYLSRNTHVLPLQEFGKANTCTVCMYPTRVLSLSLSFEWPRTYQ